MILQWRNDEFIVARSSSRRRITAEEHAKWFERVLTVREPLVFIVEHTHQAVGIVTDCAYVLSELARAL